MEKLIQRYRECRGKDPQEIYVMVNGTLGRAAEVYAARRGGSKILDSHVHYERFIDVFKTATGIDFHVFGRTKDCAGKINSFYLEDEHLALDRISPDLKKLVPVVGSNFSIHLLADTEEELSKQMQDLFHFTGYKPSLISQVLHRGFDKVYYEGKDHHSLRTRVENKYGVHARPSAEIVRTCSRFVSDVEVYDQNNEVSVSGKSIMGLMTAGFSRGHKLRWDAKGVDSEPCLEAVLSLFQSEEFKQLN